MLKRTLSSLMPTLIVAMVLPLHAAIAQSTVPNIIGHWDSVESSGATYEGVWQEEQETIHIEITEQNGHAFVGYFRWSVPNLHQDHLHDGTEHTNEAEETIVGVFTGDGASFIIAEHPDTGYMFGQVLDDDRLEILSVESGPYALAFRDIYERRR